MSESNLRRNRSANGNPFHIEVPTTENAQIYLVEACLSSVECWHFVVVAFAEGFVIEIIGQTSISCNYGDKYLSVSCPTMSTQLALMRIFLRGLT